MAGLVDRGGGGRPSGRCSRPRFSWRGAVAPDALDGAADLQPAPRPAAAAAEARRAQIVEPSPPAPAIAFAGGGAAPSVVVTPIPAPIVPAAVAARFPEPAVSFATPAFEPGRTAFTTNQELRNIIHGLERSTAIGERATAVTVLALGATPAGTPIEALAFTRPQAAPVIAGTP
jgi:hypothetical protein